MSNLELITKEINTELQKAEIQQALVMTTFKGLNLPNMKKALFEGMTRGFKFVDFLEKNIYAIPYGQNYSLVTSIDYARKIGMRSGVCGISKPEYVMEGDKIVSCSITVKRRINDYVGEYSAEVFFDEYNTGRNLWTSKPRTMIAKVAEMHALRKACPEELSQAYAEEEMERQIFVSDNIDESYKIDIDNINSIEELKKYWQENRGRGKDFDKYVMTRKQILIENEQKNG